MNKKILFFAVILIFVVSCTRDKIEPVKSFKPDFLNSPYRAYVSENGNNILKYIEAKSYSNSEGLRLGITMTSTDEQYNYYYQIGFDSRWDLLTDTDSYRLYPVGSMDPDSMISSYYVKLCCYSNPDAVYNEYNVYGSDSLNNYIRLHIDTLQNQLSGMFSATMVDDFPPHDTLRLRCDTFYCKYNIQ